MERYVHILVQVSYGGTNQPYLRPTRIEPILRPILREEENFIFPITIHPDVSGYVGIPLQVIATLSHCSFSRR